MIVLVHVYPKDSPQGPGVDVGSESVKQKPETKSITSKVMQYLQDVRQSSEHREWS